MTVFRYNEGRLTISELRLSIEELNQLRPDHGLPDMTGVQCEISGSRALWLQDGLQSPAPDVAIAAAVNLLTDETLEDDVAALRPEPDLDYEPSEWELRKLLIVDRLIEANLWEHALQALQSDIIVYHRWLAAQTILNTDVQVRGLLTAIGADPDTILAREG